MSADVPRRATRGSSLDAAGTGALAVASTSAAAIMVMAMLDVIFELHSSRCGKAERHVASGQMLWATRLRISVHVFKLVPAWRRRLHCATGGRGWLEHVVVALGLAPARRCERGDHATGEREQRESVR